MQKAALSDLALFGGPPLFQETLHVGRPNVADRERLLERINDMLDRRWFTNNGPYVQELESKLAATLGVRHCIAMCNATIGLEIVAHALDLRGEVILPSFTFIATPHAMRWLGITPVFCDIDPLTHNIDPAKIESLITPRTTAILAVHVWGRPCDVDRLQAIASKHHLKLVFDAAHALGCTYHGQMVGGFGDAEVFSFHATKFFNSFEGGAVTTNDDMLAGRLRSMRNFGFAGMDNVISVGTNGKMSEVAAAMGLTSLEGLEHFIDVNRRNYEAYCANLEGLPGLQMVRYDASEKNNWQYVILEIDPAQAGLDRDLLVQLLHAENVRARRYFYPGCHQAEPYRTEFPDAGRSLPETEKLTQRVMQLPTGTAVGASDVAGICDLIRFAVSHAAAIRAQAAAMQRV